MDPRADLDGRYLVDNCCKYVNNKCQRLTHVAMSLNSLLTDWGVGVGVGVWVEYIADNMCNFYKRITFAADQPTALRLP